MGSGQPASGWVGCFAALGQSRSGKFSGSMPNFNFFLVASKKSSGQVKKYAGPCQVGLILTAGENYARVRSQPISAQ